MIVYLLMVLRFKILFLLIIFTFSGYYSLAQREVEHDTILDIVLLRKQFSGGVILNSRGWGAQFKKGKNITYFKSFLWEINAVSMRSPKQIRTINPYFSNAKSYVYGKLNNVYVVRGGVGFDKLLNRKPYWGGVELRYVYYGGLSLAIAKPIYLYILNYTSSYYEYVIETEKYDPEKHVSDDIYGRAPFVKGLNELKFYPGIYAKFGFNFEFGVYNSKIKSLEVGAMVDLYPFPVPIMAFEDGEHYFLTFYLCFSLGKRYN